MPFYEAEQILAKDLVLPNHTAHGVKWGTAAANKYGWKDLIGAIQPKTTGANTPALGAFRGGQVRMFSFAANDLIDFVYHMPHDWVPGTDLFIHVHWGHNGTSISGSFVFDFHITYAKGFSQTTFSAEVNPTLTVSGLTITNTPQYAHRTDEIQFSVSGGDTDQLDTDDLETDGLILIQGVMTTIPTIGSGSPNNPYIYTIDIHYQSRSAGATPNKAPDFYN